MALLVDAADEVLPTLLASRRRTGLLPPIGKAAPAPLAEDGTGAGIALRVRNTFIDTAEELSPTTARFLNQREVATCPSRTVGVLKEAFGDAKPPYSPVDAADAGCEEELAWPGTATSVSRPCHYSSLHEVAVEALATAPCRMCISLAEVIDQPQPSYGIVQHEVALPSSTACWAPTTQASLHGLSTVPGPLMNGARAMLPGSGLYVQAPGAALCTEGFYANVPGLCCPTSSVAPVQPTSWSVSMYSAAEDLDAGIPPPPSRPALGSDELPSVGSAGHTAGECKPCAFFHSGRCGNGLKCQFCHLCDADERKKRRREKLDAKRVAQRSQQAPCDAKL